jgi:hypothetical protein
MEYTYISGKLRVDEVCHFQFQLIGSALKNIACIKCTIVSSTFELKSLDWQIA